VSLNIHAMNLISPEETRRYKGL